MSNHNRKEPQARTERLVALVTPDTMERIRAESEARGISHSELVNRAVKEYVK